MVILGKSETRFYDAHYLNFVNYEEKKSDVPEGLNVF